MFGWFKEKKPHENGGFKAISDRLLGPPALAVAIAETIASYEDAVRSGKAFFPAYKSKDASVIGIWSGLRLEALRSAFNFGASDPFNLSDTKQQMELLDSWLLEKPQFIFPQPSGGVIEPRRCA